MQERDSENSLISRFYVDDSEYDGCILLPPSNQKTLEWLAVLGAANLDYQLSKEKNQWRIYLSKDNQANALCQLNEYERECGYWPPKINLAFSNVGAFSISSLYVGVYLFCFFLITGPYDSARIWFVQGQGNAEKIVSGEYWRVVTALTLHSDFSHVLANTFCCVFLGGSVCQVFGYGTGWFLILVGGASANLINSLFHSPSYRYVGASTAVFAAMGILGALKFTHQLQKPSASSFRVYLPLLSVFAILSILGTGPKADILGHFMGAICGMILGYTCFRFKSQKSNFRIQFCCIILCTCILLFSWAWALE